MKQKRRKSVARSRRVKARKSKLSFMPKFRRGIQWLSISELGWPLVVAAVALGLFFALPFMASRAESMPSGPLKGMAKTLSKVAIRLHIQKSVEETDDPTVDDETSPTSQGSSGSVNKTSGPKSSNAAASNGTSTASSSQFTTLPPGSPLPSDNDCAARVRSMPETRPANSTYNNTKGTGGSTEFARVTGNYTGTTDEILQWAACKWGIDEDIARAQAVKESWWFQRTGGDWTSDPNICWPPNKVLGADPAHPGECPESVGILQVRYQYHNEGLSPGTYSPYYSTAYNADYTYAVWRDCYEGNMTWLNSVEKGAVYAAGDVWGCIGEWFSGRWLTPATMPYINAVKDYKNQRMWENSNFLSAS